MGNFFHTIQVGDPSGERFIEVEAMVDTGATLPFIPSPILKELGIVATQRGNFVLANNVRRSFDIGPALIEIGRRIRQDPSAENETTSMRITIRIIDH